MTSVCGLSFALGEATQWNAYNYSGNNPVTFSDPSGFKSWDEEEARYEMAPPRPTQMKILPGGTVITTITSGEEAGKICFDFNVCGYGYGGSDIEDHDALIAEYDRLKATDKFENSLVGTLWILDLACGNTHACGAGWANDINLSYNYLLDAEKPDTWYEALGEAFLTAFMIWAPGAIARFRIARSCGACGAVEEVAGVSGRWRGTHADFSKADQIWQDSNRYQSRGAYGKDHWGVGEDGAKEMARTMTRADLEKLG